eukprot:TRINITY_DN3366_c0_g1_i5.p1 TRINITY_DN3366_c0_g1~~TRINITY_DN3366_c0_g1_i5.p1  ORF type:complete len:633 (+),score=110.63 TRINITY_DN3366_c0_g1_i5:236-1900(+)
MVICMNAASVGLEQTLSIQDIDTTPVKVAESLFLVVYIVEFMLRIFAIGALALKDHWVKFDLFLVILGIFTNWILEPFLNSGPNELAPLMVLRTLRLLRLGKMVRFFVRFREFQMLVRGILSSAGIVLYTLIILLVILYVFSSIGIELITKHKLNMGPDPDEAFQDHVDKYFSSLPSTMFTLVQFASLDGTHDVSRLLVEKDPRLAVYFLTVVLLVGIIFMNLIAAVIVTRSIEQSLMDRDDMQNQVEHRCEVLVGNLKEMLLHNDNGESGLVSRAEIRKISGKMEKDDQQLLCDSLRVRSLMEIFEILDVDNSCKIPITELCDGIWKDIKSKEPLEVKRMQKQVDAMHFRLKEDVALERDIQSALRLVCEKVNTINSSTETLSQRIEKLASDTASHAQGLPKPKALSDLSSWIGVKPAWAEELTDEIRGIKKELTTDFEALLKFDGVTTGSASSECGAPCANCAGTSPLRSHPSKVRQREDGVAMKWLALESPRANGHTGDAFIHETASTCALRGNLIPRNNTWVMPSLNGGHTEAGFSADFKGPTISRQSAP